MLIIELFGIPYILWLRLVPHSPYSHPGPIHGMPHTTAHEAHVKAEVTNGSPQAEFCA